MAVARAAEDEDEVLEPITADDEAATANIIIGGIKKIFEDDPSGRASGIRAVQKPVPKKERGGRAPLNAIPGEDDEVASGGGDDEEASGGGDDDDR